MGARREWLSDAFDALSDAERTSLRSTGAVLRPEAQALLHALRAAGAEVVVVADTFGDGLAGAAAECAALGVSFYSNHFDPETCALSFPYTAHCCPCLSCGVCKQWIVREHAEAVIVTSSLSDRKAVLLAGRRALGGDVRRWACENGVSHVGFDAHEEMCAQVIDIVHAG